MEQLELFAVNDPEVNGFLVPSLVELKAIEAAPLIERAFAARCVDRMIMGDWEDVQVGLGLKSAEEVKQRRWKEHPESLVPSPVHESTFPRFPPKSSTSARLVRRKPKAKWRNSLARKTANANFVPSKMQSLTFESIVIFWLVWYT